MKETTIFQKEYREKKILVLALGDFGCAVSKFLQFLLPTQVMIISSPADVIPSSLEGAHTCLFVASHPVSSLCHQIDEISHMLHINFIPAVLFHPYIYLGPVTIPGEGPCYTCYERRFLQHVEHPHFYQQLYRYYDTYTTATPSGYLAPFASFTATRLVQLAEQSANTPHTIAGYLWRWNVVSSEITQSTVVGMHGCPLCGLQRDECRRSYQAMWENLQYVLPFKERKESSSDLLKDEMSRDLLVASTEHIGEEGR